MPTPPKQKTILWVSKEAPPQITGAHFEAFTSGKAAVNAWRSGKPYHVAMVDTGSLNDGLTGFDVTRNIRAVNAKAAVYMLAASINGPESVLARRMRVNGFVRRSRSDIQKALHEANALNWKHRPEIPLIEDAKQNTLGQRIKGMFKITEKSQNPTALVVHEAKVLAKKEAASNSLEDVLLDLSNLDMGYDDINVYIAPPSDDAPASNIICIGTEMPARPPRSTMHYQLKNPHEIKLLNFTKLGEDYNELDRQFAWELYTELSTRVAVTGKATDPTCVSIDGELWSESFASLLAFCKELRNLLRSYPAQHSKGSPHLGNLLLDITRIVLNPFLDKWRVDYLHWWEYESDKSKPPVLRQAEYPKTQNMLVEWRELKMTMRAVQETVLKTYKL